MNDLERLRKLAGLPGSQFNSDMNEADGVDEDHLNPDYETLEAAWEVFRQALEMFDASFDNPESIYDRPTTVGIPSLIDNIDDRMFAIKQDMYTIDYNS